MLCFKGKGWYKKKSLECLECRPLPVQILDKYLENLQSEMCIQIHIRLLLLPNVHTKCNLQNLSRSGMWQYTDTRISAA